MNFFSLSAQRVTGSNDSGRQTVAGSNDSSSQTVTESKNILCKTTREYAVPRLGQAASRTLKRYDISSDSRDFGTICAYFTCAASCHP